MKKENKFKKKCIDSNDYYDFHFHLCRIDFGFFEPFTTQTNLCRANMCVFSGRKNSEIKIYSENEKNK